MPGREIWITGGRIAAVKPAGTREESVERRAGLRRRRRHPRAGPRRSAHPHRILDGDGLRLCRGRAAQRHHHDLLRQPRDRQRHGRRRRRGDAGGRARGAALDLPDRAAHRAGDLAAAGDGRRRPDAGQDRRPVRPLAGGGRARREDGFRAGHHGRRAQPRDPRRGAEARAAGVRPYLRPRIRRGLCRERRHRHP